MRNGRSGPQIPGTDLCRPAIMKMPLTKPIAFVVLAVVAAGLAACATKTPVSGTFPAISPREAQNNEHDGTTVRWGGILIDTTPKSNETCFRVMGLPLSGDGRPQMGQGVREAGRFQACASGFYDPVLYARGREITFIGAITGVSQETVGKYKYPYPQLAASVVYLWPNAYASPNTRLYYSMYYGWGPWLGPGWGPGWWGYPWGGFLPPPPSVRPPQVQAPPRPPPPLPPPKPAPRPPHPPPSPQKPPQTKPPVF